LAAPEPGGSSGVVILLGQVTVGGVVSLLVTVTLKLHTPPLPVLQLTVVVPIGKVEPEGGLQVTSFSGGLPQLPEVVGVE
jgi:hypothetical protein